MKWLWKDPDCNLLTEKDKWDLSQKYQDIIDDMQGYETAVEDTVKDVIKNKHYKNTVDETFDE